MLSRKKIFLILAGLAVACGVWWRLINLDRPLIYDEIWGLNNWVKLPVTEILTLFNNQNNHPLNSVWMKFARSCFGYSLPMLRLHSFISGLLVILFSGAAAWLLTKKRFIALLALILTSLHPGLVYYSQVARGYSTQTAAIMLFYLLLISYHRTLFRRLGAKAAIAAGLLISFLIACFTLSTAILYLAPAVAIELLLIFVRVRSDQTISMRERLKQHAALLAGCAAITLAGAWIYIGHYRQFQAAVPAGGGAYITGTVDFFNLIIARGKNLLPWFIWTGALLPFCSKKYRYIALLTWAIPLPALLAAILIKAGPTRVYLPLVPPVSIAAATGFYCLTLFVPKYRGKLQLILALTVLGYAVLRLPKSYLTWAATDWRPIVTSLDRHYPPARSYRCYPANEGLPLSVALPREVENNIKPFFDGMLLLNLGQDRVFEGLDNHHSIARLNIKSAISPAKLRFPDGTVANIYRLRKLTLTSHPTSNLILAEIPLQPLTTARAAIGYLRSYDNWYLLNCWFNPIRQTADGRRKLLSYQLISEAKKMPIGQLVEIEQRSGGRVRFFWLEPVKKAGW